MKEGLHDRGNAGRFEFIAHIGMQASIFHAWFSTFFCWLIDYLTSADCNNPARGQKQGNIRTDDEQETERKKQTNKQTKNNQEQRRKEKQ